MKDLLFEKSTPDAQRAAIRMWRHLATVTDREYDKWTYIERDAPKEDAPLLAAMRHHCPFCTDYGRETDLQCVSCKSCPLDSGDACRYYDDWRKAREYHLTFRAQKLARRLADTMEVHYFGKVSNLEKETTK